MQVLLIIIFFVCVHPNFKFTDDFIGRKFVMSSDSGESSAPPALAPSGAAAELQPQSDAQAGSSAPPTLPVFFDDDAEAPVHTGKSLQPMERFSREVLGVLASLALHPADVLADLGSIIHLHPHRMKRKANRLRCFHSSARKLHRHRPLSSPPL